MEYEKTIRKNNEAPKINATNLNKMENGIANAVETDSIARVNNVVSRNKFNMYNLNPFTSTNITYSGNSFTVTGKIGDNKAAKYIITLQPGTYILSGTITGAADFIEFYRNGTWDGTISLNTPFTLNETTELMMYFYGSTMNNNTTATSTFTNIQLQEGSVATDYAPYLNLEEAMQPKGVTLFDGATGGNVVLSDTPSNYNTLDIYYTVGSAILVQTVKANSAYFVLTLSEIDNANSGNMGIVNYYKQYVVNGNTLTAAAAGRLFKYQMDTNVVQDKVDYLWIMKVIGYK